MVSEPEDMVSYGFLIIFSLIMLDSPRLLFSLSTWFFLSWMGQGDHTETFLLKALCCQSTPSWLKVMGWVVGGWPRALYCQHWDCFDSRFSIPSPIPSPSPSRLTKKGSSSSYSHLHLKAGLHTKFWSNSGTLICNSYR